MDNKEDTKSSIEIITIILCVRLTIISISIPFSEKEKTRLDVQDISTQWVLLLNLCRPTECLFKQQLLI